MNEPHGFIEPCGSFLYMQEKSIVQWITRVYHKNGMKYVRRKEHDPNENAIPQ